MVYAMGASALFAELSAHCNGWAVQMNAVKQNFLLAVGLLWIGYVMPQSAQSQDAGHGAEAFSAKCTSCHSVGKGDLVGPDLINVRKWSDADLTPIVRSMQNMAGPLTDAEVADLVAFLKSPNAGKELEQKQEEAKAKASIEQDKSPASAGVGRDLFYGKRPFQNGGMSCISCHNSGEGGGNLGPDLTDVASRLNETALISACENASFKVMKTAYANHKITHDEARDLSKFFETTKAEAPRKSQDVTWLAGTGIAAFALAAVGFGYRNRNSDVRGKLRRR